MSWVTGEVNLTRLLTSPRPIVVRMLARMLAAAATLCLPATAADPGSAVPGAVVAAPVVVVGIAGLTWDNLTEDGAPTLWRMLGDGADAAAMTVRTVHSPPCPLDGWLSLSAGRAATDPQPHREHDCTTIPPVAGGTVDGWAGLVTAQHASVYDPTLGLLGTTLADSNVCATAVGPGAAVALADRQGRVARYYNTARTARWDCPVTVVDAGVLDRRRDPGRALRQADDTVREVLERAPSDATVIVLGVSQPVHSTLAMSAVLVTGPGTGDQLLTAQSTRWPGIVRLLDIPSTIVGAVGVTEPERLHRRTTDRRRSPPFGGGNRQEARRRHPT